MLNSPRVTILWSGKTLILIQGRVQFGFYRCQEMTISAGVTSSLDIQPSPLLCSLHSVPILCACWIPK